MWSPGEGNGKPLHCSCLENPINSMKRQNDRILKEELHRSVQFSSVTQSCPILCDPMNRSTPGLPVHNQHSEFTQTHVHRVSDAILPSHPWSSPSPPAPNPSQHESLFQRVNSSHEVAKVLEFHFSIIPSKEIPGLTKYVPNKLLEISGEITPERMKGGSQSKNNTQLQM